MSTRIDRLFCLLQDGQNPLVRKTAAQQLGEISQMDPTKLEILLDRSYELLFCDKWESRTAAGQVIEEILKHIPIIYNSNDSKSSPLLLASSTLRVQGYDIKQIINTSKHLVESNPTQTYLDTFLKHLNTLNIFTQNQELISLLLLQRIGLITNHQITILNKLKSEYIQQIDNENKEDKDDEDIDIIQDNNVSDFNLLKIESYLEKLKETELESKENNSSKTSTKTTKLKDEDFKLLMTVRSSLHPKHEISSNKNNKIQTNKQCIIFIDWYYKLLPYLLHSHWEYRHGAAIGLRSLLKSLIVINNNNDNNNNNNNGDALFIEGCLMCLSVLLLDRYFDFQSDVTVAPICETVAQCFSLFMKYINNNNNDFIFIIKLLLQCLAIKQPKTWNVRYSGYLALKYVLPLHYKTIIGFNDDKLIKNIIESSCYGMKDNMEDVRNMSSHVLLSNISLFIAHNNRDKENKEEMMKLQNIVFESLLFALNNIEEYTSATMGVLSVLYTVLDEFPDLIIQYVQNMDNNTFSNIFNILLKILNHLSMDMKKQAIKTLHKFIQFVSNINIKNKQNVINEKQIISLIQIIFEKLMFEQHKYIKESIEILKDDNDEYQMYLQYKSFINDLENIWIWICQNLKDLIQINGTSLPTEYQQMILKLFESFQKYATFKKKKNDKHEEEQLPTQQLLEKIEEMKNIKNNNKSLNVNTKKRKKMDNNDDHENNIEPPTKKRKLNSNDTENTTNTASEKESVSNISKSMGNQYEYPQEIILWSIIDGGCVLLSKLFTSEPIYSSGWSIIQYLLIQFLSQEKKQKINKKKNKKKKKKKNQEIQHIVYGWRRILGCWLLSDCYNKLKKYNMNEMKEENDNNNKQIMNIIGSLQKVTHSDIYREYDELKLRRQIIEHQTKNLISTFKHCSTVYDAMNEHFDGLPFCDYVDAVTKRYNEWKLCDNKNNKKNVERDNYYKLLLATVLNAQYALDSHGLLLQCSISNILINNGDILKKDDIESILESVVTALKTENTPNLQYRSGESLALIMKLLCDVGGKQNEDILYKIFNNLIADCRDNIECKPKNGTRMVIQHICDIFGDSIFDKLPFIITKMKDKLMTINEEEEDDNDDDDDDDGFFNDLEIKMSDWIPMAQIFACFVTSIKSSDVRNKYLKSLLQPIIKGIYMIDEDEDDDTLYYTDNGICAQSRYCILSYLYCEPNIILPLIIKHIIPSLYNDDIFDRLGAVELIWDILYSIDNIEIKEEKEKERKKNKCQRYKNYAQLNIEKNQKTLLMEIIPYLSSLIVPLLRNMTDFNDTIRKRANQIFSMSVRLIPLEYGLPDPLSMSIELKQQRAKNQLILKQLIDPSTIDSFKCPFKYNATLREYQQDGVNWLWFLYRFHLHGILADDMGLGKTLQSLLIITASYMYNASKHEYDDNDNDKKEASIPSLIICPSTLVWHWPHEINKFIPNLLIPFIIDGKPQKRRNLYSKLDENKEDGNNYIVIMSYNTMKNDIEYITSRNWHYCVLDEGHLIKNPKSKTSIAVKTISCKYRLILSGTPIQNNVLDLWSLFDFLMPGFLGNESWFKKNFSSPIINSYKSKSDKNSRQQRLGALKLEHLHKMVLPFIMRRLKCDVLKELPPKIIQDIEVDMSEIQKILYKQFINSGKFKCISIDNKNKNKNNELNKSGMQSLLYMRKLVVHPKLIMTKQHPLFHDTLSILQKDNLSLESIDIAPKFKALKSLIEQCNIDESGNDNKLIESHRMLIFVQYTEVITLIEDLLLNQYFPDLKYLTLTGKLTSSERFNVVKQFNKNREEIKLLLLTVNVGGLGLNLNTADIVVFMEHDWNPMKDLQAMDRAHRIGQTKTVHVFRIIVRNTIEWEIMNKQKFKQHIANTVISNENRSLSSIASGTGSILDLFYMNNKNINNNNNNDDNRSVDTFGEIHNKTKKQKALDQMLENLSSMNIINQQYADEYDLKKFITDLK